MIGEYWGFCSSPLDQDLMSEIAIAVRSKDLHCLRHRQNSGTRVCGILHYVFEKPWRAPKRRRRIGNIMGREDQPAMLNAIAVDDLSHQLNIAASLLQEKCIELVQIGVSGIDALCPPAAGEKMT